MANINDIVLNWQPRKQDYRDFALAAYITPSILARAVKLTAMDWAVKRILDQGNKPHCVGYCNGMFGIAVPVVDDWQNDMGDKIYYAAKIIDGEPGQEDGTDSRSGIKAFMQFAKLQGNAYAFAGSMQNVIDWLLAVGPVNTGTDWTYDMMTPDGNFVLHPTGGVAGGHEWLLTGVDTVARMFHMTNSWGESWGNHGQAMIGFDDYATLLKNQGDAVTATEVASVPVPPTPDPIPTPAPVPVPNGPTAKHVLAAIKDAHHIIKVLGG